MTETTPTPSAALALIGDPAQFGRVAEDGTVYVITPEGEKAVGSYPGKTAEEALASLDTLPTKGRKIAALGDMLELGRYSIAEHEKIGALAAKHADILVTVGIRSSATAEAARQNGLAVDLVHSFDSAVEAAAFLHEFLEEGDVVLINGSQGMRMERVTEVLLHDKKDTHKLVRQEKEWKKRR